MGRVDAIVLAGGRAVRLGGVAKPALAGADGRTTLRRALDACADVGVERVVVVGPPDDLAGLLGPYAARVTVVQEDPPWSGPARAIAAGVAALAGDAGGATLVLACDVADVAAGVRALVAAGLDREGVIANAGGRRQWLLGMYRQAELAAACARLPRPAAGVRDPSAWELLGDLDLVDVTLPDGVADDLDTPADLDRLGFSGPHAV